MEKHGRMRTYLKDTWWIFALTILLILLARFIYYRGVLPMQEQAAERGEFLGSEAGKLAGNLAGSLRGMTEGAESGKEAGREEGLKAEDTTVQVQQALALGKLQVMTASVKVNNYHEMGNTYAALYLLRGDVVFTLDLEQVQVYTAEDGSIVISLPVPESKLSFRHDETQKVMEYQKAIFDGTSDDGFEAYLNSMVEAEQKAQESIPNYSTLMQQAKEAAQRQVEMLVRNVCGSDVSFRIEFHQ